MLKYRIVKCLNNGQIKKYVILEGDEWEGSNRSRVIKIDR